MEDTKPTKPVSPAPTEPTSTDPLKTPTIEPEPTTKFEPAVFHPEPAAPASPATPTSSTPISVTEPKPDQPAGLVADPTKPTLDLHSSTPASDFNTPHPLFSPDAPTGNSFGATPSKGGKSKKIALLAAVVVVVLLLGGGGAAAYLGLIGPNTPENMWAKAMDNTAKGYDRLITYQKDHAGDKGADVKGTFKVDSQAFKTDGSMSASWYDGSGEGKLDVGLGVSRATLEARVIKSTASKNPDVYVNVSGIKGLGRQLGASQYEPTLTKVDNKWITIDHTMIDNLEGQLGQESSAPKFSQADGQEVAVKVGEALKMHIFTADKTKSAVVIKQKIGKEDFEGRSTYHYKAGVDKQNLKTFVKQLKTNLEQTKLNKTLGEGVLSQAVDYDSMAKEIDKIDTNKAVADVWVDTKTKMFNNVRITDGHNHFDFGVPYTGGDNIPFVFKVTTMEDGGAEAKGAIKASLNTKTNETKMDFTLDITGSKSADENFTAEASLTINPRTSALKITKPANSMTFAEFLNQLDATGLETGGISDVLGVKTTLPASSHSTTLNSPSSSTSSTNRNSTTPAPATTPSSTYRY